MPIAPNGQRTAHSAQPVQPAASCSVEVLRPPPACSDSTCGAHTPMHQPQPVQRAGGRLHGCSVGNRTITCSSSARLSVMTLVRQAGELGLNISR